MFSLIRKRSKIATVIRSVAVACLVILAALVAWLTWLVRAPLPKVDGTLGVTGIGEPVVIRRDERGIPHIDAQREHDLFFAEGFTCAQDRLWQMDGERRLAEGQLSEIAGAQALATDRYMRTLGLGAAAQRDARLLRGMMRDDIQAYADGVNAAMASHPLPLEFHLLRYAPRPWTTTDSVAIIKLEAQRLDDQWAKIEILARLQEAVGVQAARALTNNQDPKMEVFIPGYGLQKGRPSHQPVAARDSISWTRYEPPLQSPPDTGSNNWVVAGRKTNTGKPVLADDVHLDHSVPSTWWLVHLRGAGYDVAGFTIPGIPGVVVGHNERIAFGVTAAAEAVQDLYIERFRSVDSDQYFANGRWIRAQHRIERIPIKNHPDEILNVLVTRHGPIMDRHGVRGLALEWTALQRGGEVGALRDVDRAQNWEQFRLALEQITAPVLSFVYADVDGNIGYQEAGTVPRRKFGDGGLPVEGEDGRFDWSGYIPFNQLPYSFNPAQSAIATANNELVAPGAAFPQSPFFDAPYRVHQIAIRLSKPGVKTVGDIGAIQADVYDNPHLELARVTARVLAPLQDPMLRKIATQLATWDGNDSRDSTIPTYLDAEERALVDCLLLQRLGADLLRRYRADYHPLIAIERALNGDNSLSELGITKASVGLAIRIAAERAASETRANARDGISRIQNWGNHNAAIYNHPLGRFWPLSAMLNIRPISQPGTTFTVYAGRPTHGPALRLVNDLSNWDNSSMLLTLGESGHFSDGHYADQSEDFAEVRWARTAFSEAAIAKSTRNTLHLQPRK